MRLDIAQSIKPRHTIGNPAAELYAVDILQGISIVSDESVSVIVTSPPYNGGIKYGVYRDDLDDGDYIDWMGRVARVLSRVLQPRGSLFLNIGAKPSKPALPWEVAKRFRDEAGFRIQNTIHWIKSIAIEEPDDTIVRGHYRPMTSDRFIHNAHEYIFHFTREGDVKIDPLAIGVPYQDKSNVKRWKREQRDLRSRGNTWFIPYETMNGLASRPHPAVFPVKLPEMCIKLHGRHDTSLVLDPFIGIGSTALACQRLGLACVGFDIDESYIDTAADRLRQSMMVSS